MLFEPILPLDIYFYIYLVIALLLIGITTIILKKSTSRVNILFIITPVLFVIILVFNMLTYYFIVPRFFLWFPYLLAPAGMIFAARYILYGSALSVNRIVLFLEYTYTAFALFSSIYLQLIYPANNLQFIGVIHVALALPFFLATIEYYKIIPLIPDQKRKIYSLDFGLILVMLGTILRGLNYFALEEDSVIGFTLIIIGIFLIILSFTNLLQLDNIELAGKIPVQNV